MTARNKTPKATRPQIPGYGLPKSKKGLLPWKWAEDRVKKTREYWIATTRPDGRPHVMIVWALWMDGAIYFSTGAKTVKAGNLAKNPHCTMCTQNSSEAVIVEGVVETERNVEAIRKFVPLYERKYKFKLGEMGENLIALKDPLFCLRPKVAFGLWEKKFATTATRWVF
ncbi:MAG TPA: pyridoxamine 5'-phosphate oxidase family protein [Terriglobales bacterium]|nr:pyridoxamine 5'-phosphate oxidase family protein [Terriglobales bacterium]